MVSHKQIVFVFRPPNCYWMVGGKGRGGGRKKIMPLYIKPLIHYGTCCLSLLPLLVIHMILTNKKNNPNAVEKISF
jgi:hypothetical protein